MSRIGSPRIVAVAALGLAAVFGLAMGIAGMSVLREATQQAVDAARHAGPAGVLAFVVVQLIVAASGVLPASALGVAAGTAYGLSLGFLIAAVGTMAGALAAFVLARSFLRGAIECHVARRPRLARFDALLAQDGWRIVCLLRMSPVMPFAATSYALGVSAVGIEVYLVGTLASLPALLGYVYIGTLAGTGLSAWRAGAQPLQWALLGLGILATVALTLLIGRLAQRALELAATEEGNTA